MDTLITYMFQITVAFMIIQVCIPIVIILKGKAKTQANNKNNDLNQLELDEKEHQHFLREVDAILNMNHISHCDE
ncbi:hypothetical protein [Mucilaginibacter pocheonensis]|uniref:Uncharacterized protein n=1 Tax=Mucilaginibacter pocheonensis TaxID=398050 RepID=A0ABU1T6F5_9SPHI|nr:hypothetical protein [Mucilaginibacter pocheonensis]MDR6940975.1 hypothetical protein [Mucilaginibacter pocheonensis]